MTRAHSCSPLDVNVTGPCKDMVTGGGSNVITITSIYCDIVGILRITDTIAHYFEIGIPKQVNEYGAHNYYDFLHQYWYVVDRYSRYMYIHCVVF